LPELPKQLESGEEQWAVVEETGEIVEPEEEGESEESVLDEELVSALSVKLHLKAPLLGLEAGQSLLDAVKHGERAKDLIEYLSKPSSYEAQTEETITLQEAAALVFLYFDTAVEMAGKGGGTEQEAEEIHVEEGGDNGENLPLF